MQGAKAELEVQLRVMRQERNALTATLRQHGLLGKLVSGKLALPLNANAAGKLGPKAVTVKENAHSSICQQAVRQSASSSDSEHSRQDSLLQENQNSNESRQSPRTVKSQANSLQDITNASLSVSEHAVSKPQHVTQANASQHRFVPGTSHSVEGNPICSAEPHSESTQAKLRSLEQMAQLLLM